MQKLVYPKSKRGNVVDQRFGKTIADPYRWLEHDVREDADVAAWVTAQSELAENYLAKLPGRAAFRKSLASLFDYERVTAPHERAGRYFYTRHSGLQNQPTLVLREGVEGEERILLDPNGWADDSATALAEWAASDDGKFVAYAVQEGGTDWRTIKVLNVDTGATLDDHVAWSRFSNISWLTDGSGFLYSRYPNPEPSAVYRASVKGHAVYFHALGTDQEQDRLVFATPEKPHLLHIAGVTEDGRYAIVNSMPGPGTNALTIIDLATDDWTSRHLVEDLDAEWIPRGNIGTNFFLTTSKNASRRKIVSIDLADTEFQPKTIVPEQDNVLSSAWLVGGQLIAAYRVDAKTELRRYRLDGSSDGVVTLPGIGSAGGFCGHETSNDAFFVFTSFNAPTTVYRYDVARNLSTVWAEPKTSFDPDSIVVEQHFATSKDGTRIPLFVVRRRDVSLPASTVLYAYGGFGISMIPYYSPPQLAWIEQGGVFVVANIRGGDEYGKAWHDAGRLHNKQNVFDDYIAVAEFLKRRSIAPADGLAIQGDSNGGLLVGAVTNQRPDLFAAALPGVGVMDMLRFHEFTGGQLWMEDYGDPRREADFKTLQAYSPYHNVEAGKTYPAVLALTADTDDRVVPGHTFKYVAALQNADPNGKPHLVRIETRAGHGAGKPMDKVIAENADMWAFAAHWTGLKVG